MKLIFLFESQRIVNPIHPEPTPTSTKSSSSWSKLLIIFVASSAKISVSNRGIRTFEFTKKSLPKK